MSKRTSGEKIYLEYKPLLPIWQQDPSKSTGLYSDQYLLGYREAIEDLVGGIENGDYDE